MAIHTSSYESFSAHGSHKQDYFDPRFRRGRIVKSMMFPIVAFMIVVLLLTYMSFISKRFHIHGNQNFDNSNKISNSLGRSLPIDSNIRDFSLLRRFGRDHNQVSQLKEHKRDSEVHSGSDTISSSQQSRDWDKDNRNDNEDDWEDNVEFEDDNLLASREPMGKVTDDFLRPNVSVNQGGFDEGNAKHKLEKQTHHNKVSQLKERKRNLEVHFGLDTISSSQLSRDWDEDDKNGNEDDGENNVEFEEGSLLASEEPMGKVTNDFLRTNISVNQDDSSEGTPKHKSGRQTHHIQATQPKEHERDSEVHSGLDSTGSSQQSRDSDKHNMKRDKDNREINKMVKEGSPLVSGKPMKKVTKDFACSCLCNEKAPKVKHSRPIVRVHRDSFGKRLPKHKPRRQTRGPCEIDFLNMNDSTAMPNNLLNFSKFPLEYTGKEEKPYGLEFDTWAPRFAGHQSVEERENSFFAGEQEVHCGFVKGPIGSPSTGFDLSEKDKQYMSSCSIVVTSCIFGNLDVVRNPIEDKISKASKKNVCFVMFVDEETFEELYLEGDVVNDEGYLGLWKVVVVKNLPYTDKRKAGKVAKLLQHRIFPNSRYSIWIDGKLQLQADPLLILEHFLWREEHEYAISNHYDRHCVWEEVLQNKRLNKYNHMVIDEQFLFYQSDGLTKFNKSDPNNLLPSYVPEGSFIVRAHTPMSNLFSCLWFNEVDQFTSRDQLSFAYTYLKLRRMNPDKPFSLNMFKDCERKAIVKLFPHRGVNPPPATAV
ncbi:hypothetical protein AMTRI_Chr04g252860 [Amborella trichopoda]